MKYIRILLRIIPVGVWLAVGMSYSHAQLLFKGSVTDAATGQPVEMATVQLLRGSAKRMLGYTLTDATGAFTLKGGKDADTDSLQVSVSFLGYQTLTKDVRPGETLALSLETKAFQLKEVQVRPGRVYGNRDTVNYDVAQFLSGKDESIKDVIKKLPGLDVNEETGKISYNGKDISNFYVEGMDLTNGRYNRINNNLQAKAVEKVQVLQNHQPIRLLQDRVKVEDVAINLTLKPEFRDIWMGSVKAGAGLSADDFLWEGGLDAMQLSRASQTAYLYKGNNRGVDVTDEQLMLVGNAFNTLREPAVPSFLSQPSLMAPLKKERLLFNDAHTLSANRLYKLDETTRLRFNAGYTHDVRRQERGSTTTYYQAEDTVRVTEASDTRIRSDRADLHLDIEQNAATHFLTNKLDAVGDWQRSRSQFIGHGEVDQRINTSQAGVRNEFRTLWNRGDNTWEMRSFLRYNYLPAELIVNGVGETMNLGQFYTDNSFAYLRKKGILSQRYTVGTTGQASTIRDGWGTYLTPFWQATIDKWMATLTLPLVWTAYPGAGFSRLSPNPSLAVEYKLNYAWRFTLSGNYREQLGNETDFYALPYQRDYRNRILNDGSLSVLQQQNYRVYGEYRNTIREFFATLSLSYIRSESNRMYEQLFDGGQVTLASRPMANRSSGWNLNGALSKGFYDWKMKASLNWAFSRQDGEQLSEGVRMPFRSEYMQYEPKISWVPNKRLDIGYQSTIRYGGSRLGESTTLTPLWNVVQKMNVGYAVFPIELNLAADHYYNDVSKDKSVNAFLVDLSLKWKYGSWLLEAGANNVFDKRQYGYTQYSSLESYTSWIQIRGREFFLSVRYRFK